MFYYFGHIQEHYLQGDSPASQPDGYRLLSIKQVNTGEAAP